MADLTLQLSDEHRAKAPEEVLKLFDEEIEKFSKYMTTIGDWRSVGALNAQERALLKSYLVHKHRGHVDGA